MQNACWEPEVERWESGEENDDGEDHEQDFYAAAVDLMEEAILLALCAWACVHTTSSYLYVITSSRRTSRN